MFVVALDANPATAIVNANSRPSGEQFSAALLRKLLRKEKLGDVHDKVRKNSEITSPIIPLDSVPLWFGPVHRLYQLIRTSVIVTFKDARLKSLLLHVRCVRSTDVIVETKALYTKIQTTTTCSFRSDCNQNPCPDTWVLYLVFTLRVYLWFLIVGNDAYTIPWLKLKIFLERS